MNQLFEQWLQAKADEAEIVAKRREIEDELTKYFQLNEMHEGSKTHNIDGFSCKITQRLTKKIDGDQLQEIAAQEGLQDHLNYLFRWKPEVNKKEWDLARESITGPLSQAITVKSGRPSYNISIKEK